MIDSSFLSNIFEFELINGPFFFRKFTSLKRASPEDLIFISSAKEAKKKTLISKLRQLLQLQN